MMIALISDIHGNYVALQKVLAEIVRLNIKKIFCLGDIVGYYPQINECIDALVKHNVKCILGNHDWYMISNTRCLRSKSVNDCLDYQRKIISRSSIDFLKSLPITINYEELSMVHGGWKNPLDEYIELNEAYFDFVDGKYFASGHSHVPIIQTFGQKLYCNPGSVGQPRDLNHHSSFATFNTVDKIFHLHRVDYDIDKVATIMRSLGFDEYYYGGLYNGNKTLTKIIK